MAEKCWVAFTKWHPDPEVARKRAVAPDGGRDAAGMLAKLKPSQPLTRGLSAGETFHFPVFAAGVPVQYGFVGYDDKP